MCTVPTNRTARTARCSDNVKLVVGIFIEFAPFMMLRVTFVARECRIYPSGSHC